MTNQMLELIKLYGSGSEGFTPMTLMIAVGAIIEEKRALEAYSATLEDDLVRMEVKLDDMSAFVDDICNVDEVGALLPVYFDWRNTAQHPDSKDVVLSAVTELASNLKILYETEDDLARLQDYLKATSDELKCAQEEIKELEAKLVLERGD
jgi:hypothetical protein